MRLTEEQEEAIRQLVAQYLEEKERRNQKSTIREIIEFVGLGETIYSLIEAILEGE
jgi:hypothetical protein